MEIVQTGDGSKTLFHAQIGENYHSKHGALAESRHVFVKMGLESFFEKSVVTQPIRVLEVGFGTGLNFITSLESAYAHNFSIRYHGVEAFPLELDLIKALGHTVRFMELTGQEFDSVYHEVLHASEPVELPNNCCLKVEVNKILDCSWDTNYHVVYFDAFAAIHQPEMWTPEVLAHVTAPLISGGYFVTYAITGDLKRSLKSLGMEIQKLPGAPGKREMLRAIKI